MTARRTVNDRRRSSRGSVLASLAAVSCVAVAFVIGWYGVVWSFDLPRILLPFPHEVALAAWKSRWELLGAAATTGLTAAAGLLVAVTVGCLIAVVFSQSKLLRRAFFPYVVFLQTVPIVAIAPLLITWSGYQFRTTVIATVIVCLFPIINNVTTGLSAADREFQDLFRLYGAGRVKQLIWLQIPTAIPYLILGMRVSAGLAVVGAIIAEFFVSNGTDYVGLGAKIPHWHGFAQTDLLIAALFSSALLGLLLFGLVQLIDSTLLRRWTRVRR